MELDGIFLTLGALFLVGLAADQIGRRTRLPRVTLLLGMGIVAGDSGLGLLPEAVRVWFPFLSITALTMVAFLLGGSLTRREMSEHGQAILWLSVSIVAVTLVVVGFGLAAAGLPLGLALLLAAVATATDPAATQDALRQIRAEGAFADTIRGVVAIDDAWGVMVFSVVLVVVGYLTGTVGESEGASLLTRGAWEIGGAILLGLALGVPGAALTGRLSPGEPQQSEALGIVFLTAGLSIWLEVSYLIAGMTVGAVIVNRARHHERAFHEIEGIQWPFMLLFFVLAGASLDLSALTEIGWIGAAYVALRGVARLIGGWTGAVLGGTAAAERPWYGIALMPQAGVAIGMALVAAAQFPAWAETIMVLTVGTTVVFELIGPPATMVAAGRVAARQPA